MSERLTSGPFEFDQKQVMDIRKIGDRALSIVYNDFGSGFPDFEGGHVRLLPFHGVDHSASVASNSTLVGAAYGINESGLELLSTFGKSHDLRQLNGRGTDERLSAEWLEEQLLSEGLPPLAARFGRVAIIGTEPLFDENGNLVDQMVNQLDFDSWEEELFAKSLASGDLGDLYTPKGPLNSGYLYAEIQRSLDPPSDGLLDFQGRQIALLERYQYPLSQAGDVLATHRPQVMNYQYFIYDQLESYQISSWQDLMHRHYAFMQNPDMSLR
jgi:hypothetical protein